jgi:hypothetical protein
MSFAHRAGRMAAAALFASASIYSVSASALDPLLPPSSNFDLTHWKLTLPSAKEIMPWTLSQSYSLANTFYTDTRSGGMVFRCPNIASTTTNSNYSRTELREMLDPMNSDAKADSNNWTMAVGGRMKARLRVDRVSTTGDSGKVGRVIVGQIHGPDTEPVRLYYSKKPTEAKGRMYIASETMSGSNSYSTDIVSNLNGDGIALGELFTYVITLKGTLLRVDIIRNAGAVTNTYVKNIDPNYAGKNLYFKAGVYNQNNTGTSTDYVQATFYTLTHTHP